MSLSIELVGDEYRIDASGITDDDRLLVMFENGQTVRLQGSRHTQELWVDWTDAPEDFEFLVRLQESGSYRPDFRFAVRSPLARNGYVHFELLRGMTEDHLRPPQSLGGCTPRSRVIAVEPVTTEQLRTHLFK